MIRSFAHLFGFSVALSALLAISTSTLCVDLSHDVTDKARQNIGMIIHAFENSTKRATDNATRNLIALAYSLAGLYAIASNTISDENDQERYTKGNFACQLALGLSLAGFGYHVLHSGA